jgi:hypothetical protein
MAVSPAEHAMTTAAIHALFDTSVGAHGVVFEYGNLRPGNRWPLRRWLLKQSAHPE